MDEKLKHFSVELIQEIIKFCDKTLQQTAKERTEKDNALKAMATKDDYQETKEVIRANKDNNKKILSHRKNIKFNSLKYNASGRSQHQTNQRDATSERSKSPFSNHFQDRNSQQQHKIRQAYQVNQDNQIYQIREPVEQRYHPTNKTREPTEERNRPTRTEPTKSYVEVLRGSTSFNFSCRTCLW